MPGTAVSGRNTAANKAKRENETVNKELML